MQLIGSRVQSIQVPECSPEGRRNVSGKAAREQTLGWVSTDIYMLLYVFDLYFCFSYACHCCLNYVGGLLDAQ
jgi:hypothetical protein